MSAGERQPPDLFDPQDNADQLDERAGLISDARDEAFDRGYEDYRADADAERESLGLYDHPRLQQDFRDGWELAAGEERSRVEREGE